MDLHIPEQLKKKAGKFASRFAFEFFVADKNDEIMAEIKKWLAPFSEDDIRKLIKEAAYPYIPPHIFQMVGSDVAGFIDFVDAPRLWKFLVEARSDLAVAIDGEGDAGYKWFGKLRDHFAACVKDPSLSQAQAPVMKDKIVIVHCDACGKDFPMPKTEAVKLEKCPGCGAPAK